MSIRIINSGSTEGRPISLKWGSKLFVEVGERCRHEYVHPAQQVVLGDAIFELELVEQTALIAPLPPHHPPSSDAADQSAIGITVRGLSQALFRQHLPIPDFSMRSPSRWQELFVLKDA